MSSKTILPEWYRKKEEKNENDLISIDAANTIKRCMPLFDSMTAGYIIKTYVDIKVSIVGEQYYFQWPSFSPIEFHHESQAQNYPKKTGSNFPKFMNPFAIKTPKGYSCLFTSPMHHENKYFEILSGIVDTDTFFHPVNFPFVMKDREWEGVIPAGTPLAQVIPIKRDSWEINFGGEKELKEVENVGLSLFSLWKDRYKRKFWNKKMYN